MAVKLQTKRLSDPQLRVGIGQYFREVAVGCVQAGRCLFPNLLMTTRDILLLPLFVLRLSTFHIIAPLACLDSHIAQLAQTLVHRSSLSRLRSFSQEVLHWTSLRIVQASNPVSTQAASRLVDLRKQAHVVDHLCECCCRELQASS